MFYFIEKAMENLQDKVSYVQIWQLKTIRFDSQQQQQRKSIQVYYGISNGVQDIKGNPGLRGSFYLTNLRLYWHAMPDKTLNLSVGIDCINNVMIKSFPSQAQNIIKHMLIIKAQNHTQTRYQFRFCSVLDSDLQLFEKVNLMHKQAQNNKFLRNIDLKVKQIDGKYICIDQEQVKSKFQSLYFIQNESVFPVNVYLTNVRMSIIHKSSNNSPTLSYGIPWICIKSIQKDQYNSWPAIKLQTRGLLRGNETTLYGKSGQFQKFLKEFMSFCQIYTKNPILGLQLHSSKVQQKQIKTEKDFEQIQATNVNIRRNKNPYSIQQQKGDLSNTQFNEQLGIMMEKFPAGVSRSQLWQILRD